MTAEDIKAQYSMRDVVEQCGITVDRTNKAHCPFHSGDRTASLHIYSDHFYCFGCGAKGDIFTFLMKLNDYDFNSAFEALGGKREKLTDTAYYRIAKRKAEQAKRQQAVNDAQQKYHHAIEQLNIWRNIFEMAKSEPFSDGFCLALNWVNKWDVEADEALEHYFEVKEQNK